MINGMYLLTDAKHLKKLRLVFNMCNSLLILQLLSGM